MQAPSAKPPPALGRILSNRPSKTSPRPFITKKPTAKDAVEGSHAGTGSRCQLLAEIPMQRTPSEPDTANFRPRMNNAVQFPSLFSHALKKPIRKNKENTVATTAIDVATMTPRSERDVPG